MLLLAFGKVAGPFVVQIPKVTSHMQQQQCPEPGKSSVCSPQGMKPASGLCKRFSSMAMFSTQDSTLTSVEPSLVNASISTLASSQFMYTLPGLVPSINLNTSQVAHSFQMHVLGSSLCSISLPSNCFYSTLDGSHVAARSKQLPPLVPRLASPPTDGHAESARGR